MKKSKRERNTFYEELKGTTGEIISQVKELIRKGNARRLMIKNKEGKVVYQIQLTAGVATTAFVAVTSPIISALSMAAMVMNNFKVVVERYPEDEAPTDEHEVDAEVIIDIEDEEDTLDGSEENERTDKTVGKDKNGKNDNE